MKLGRKMKGYIMLTISSFLWGTAFLFSQYILDSGMRSEDIVFWKMLFAFLVMIMYTYYKDVELLKLDKRGILSTALMGLICHSLFNLFLFKAMERTTIATTVSILYTAPIFVIIMSRIILKERPTISSYLAIIACVIGVSLTITGGDFKQLNFNIIGVLYGLAAGITYAVMNVYSKLLLNRYRELTILTYTLGFATCFSLIFSNPFAVLEIKGNILVWLCLIILGVVSTAFSYLVFTTGLAYGVESTKAAIISSLEVPVSVLGSYFIFGQRIVFLQFIGIVLILYSVVLLQNKPLLFSKYNEKIYHE